MINMRRVKASFMFFLIFCSIFLAASSFTKLEVKGTEQVLFEDDFEDYNVDTFPNSGGWELWFNGAGTEHQAIVDNVFVSPTKSLKLLGVSFWAGFAAKRLTSSSPRIGFEVAVRVEEANGISRDNARIAFTKKVNGAISCEYAPITFQDTGTINSGGKVLQSYVAGRWYKIKSILDRNTDTYSVWVDGELKGENLIATTTSGDIASNPSSEIEAFSVSQCYNSVNAYFDDVKVFEVSGAGSNTWTVDDDGAADFSTIQEAVNAASDGDTIHVHAGTYYENVTVTKSITLKGESSSNTIIDGGGGTSLVVYVNNVDNVEITGFKIQNGYDGVYIYNSSLVTVSGNIITNNSFRGIILSCSSSNTISENMLTNNNDGIELYKSSQITVSENTVTNSRFGIGISRSNSNTISGNTLTNSEDGLYIWNVSYTTVSGNIIENSANNGISLTISSNCNFYGNTITNSAYRGIILGNSSNCDVSGNVITNSTVQGILLTVSSSSTVSENTLTDNSGAIQLYKSSHITASGNTITSNKIGFGVSNSSDNSFYHNNIINNTIQAYTVGSTNIWDDGYPSGGNYWGDYNGQDSDGDGIGDVPYSINGDNQDNYPLMNPWDVEGANVAIDPDAWTVDDDGTADFQTIQEAIDAAGDGETILVYSGTYYENIVVNKPLVIKSYNGAEKTIVCTPDPETGKNVFEIKADNVEIIGFTIENSAKRTISGNPFDTSDYVDACGIYVGTHSGTKISGNIIRNNFEGVVFADCSNIFISENQITENIHGGVRIAYSSSATITKNSITSNHNPELLGATGLVVFHCTKSEASENQIVGNDNGAVISNSQGISFSNNSVTDNGFHGLNIVNGGGHRIFGNIMIKNTYGICPSGGSNIQIYENTLQENDCGIACYGASNNFIYHNQFLNNSIQVSNFHGYETNSWDNGYLSGGNYWSDYNGPDSDGDGFGDVPYLIDENNRDNYPLMNPWRPTSSLSYKLIVDSLPSGVTFTVDDVSRTTPWSETYNETTSVNLAMPESYSFEGENYIWWRWSDGNSNRIRTVTVDSSTALTAMFRPEDTSLKISVLSPENKTYAKTDIPLEITVNRIFFGTSYSLDGQANVTIFGNTTLTGLSEGPHNIVVYIEDSPGNIRSSEIIYFTVATTSSGISILSPENKTYNTRDVQLTYTKNETLYFASYRLDGQLNYTDPVNTTLTGLADGAHQLIIYANYTGSFWGESITVYFTVDTTPPNIMDVTHVQIENNKTSEYGIEVSATVTDAVSGVEWVALNYTLGDGTWVIAEMTNLGGNIWTGTIPPLSHGTNVTYIIIARDNAQNTITSEELFGAPISYEVLPEFTSWIILPIFLVVTLFTIVIRKRKLQIELSGA